MSCKESIQNAAVSHNDEWGNTVSAHLDVVIDLVAAEAKYKKLFKMPYINKRGRAQEDDLANAFEHLFTFLKENDECQYSIEEHLQRLAEYLPPSTSVCSKKTLKQNL